MPPATALRTRAQRWFERRTRLPRRLRVTREGKVFIGVTLGVGFAAINTGNNLLYLVLGLLLSIIVLSGVLSEMALRGLQFRRRLPRRAFAGTAMLVEIEVRNTKRYTPSYSIEVEDRIDRRRTDKRCYFLKVSAGARQTAAYRRTPPVRGPERYAALRVATRFPFGLFEKWREIELVEEQLVYPAPLRAPRPRVPATVAGDATPREGRGRGEVDGVRELRGDEPARDIDWKKTAALGRLAARERQREGTRKLLIEIANRAPERARVSADASAKVRTAGRADAAEDADAAGAEFARRLEDELRRAAWAALDALHSGTAVELRAQDGGDGAAKVLHAAPSSHAADRVLGFLARLPPEPRTPEASAGANAGGNGGASKAPAPRASASAGAGAGAGAGATASASTRARAEELPS